MGRSSPKVFTQDQGSTECAPPLLGGALLNVLTLASRGLSRTRAHKSSATRVTDRRISQTEAQSLNFFPLCVLWNSKQRSHRFDSRVSNPLGARKIRDGLGERVKNFLADFFPLRGGRYPPIPLSFFGHNDFPLRGKGSVKDKNG